MKQPIFLILGVVILVLIGTANAAQDKTDQANAAQQSPATTPTPALQVGQTLNLTGKIVFTYGDPPPNSGLPRQLVVFLSGDDGKMYELRLDLTRIKVTNGERVQISGQVLLPFLPEQPQTRFSVIQVASAQPITVKPFGGEQSLAGTQPWINVLCRFSDITSTPQAPSWYSPLMGNTYPGLDHYWRQISYNNINLTGSATTTLWYVLPQPRSYYIASGTYGANLAKLIEDCTAAANPDVYFPNYVGINLMFNDSLDCCAWGGGWNLSLDGVEKFYRTTWLPPWAQAQSLMAHEMGHGFGLPHSSGPSDNPPSELSIYVSQWDVMSASGGTCAVYHSDYGCIAPGTIAHHLDLDQWIPANRKITVDPTQSRTVTLEQLILPVSGTNYLMAKIPIAGSSTHFYTVETRTFSGYDQNVPNQAVVIHDVDTQRQGNTGPALVVDADDGNDDVNDAGAMWTVGETYVDAINNISIEVTGSTASSFTVVIGPATAPNLTFTPTDDAYVTQLYPNSNYGSGTDIRLRKTSSDDLDSYLKFNVIGLTGSVQQATLRLYVTDASDNGGAVYLTSNTWTESSITWANRPQPVGSALDSLGTVAVGTWVEYDVTVAITTNNTYSFVLSNSSSNNVIFRSSEATANKPQLVIQTGPVQPPITPPSFRVTDSTASSITLGWDDVGNETGYKIYRWGFDGTEWRFIYYDSVGQNVSTYTDTGLDCAADYYYELAAYNNYGESSHAGWIQGITDGCMVSGNIRTAGGTPISGVVMNGLPLNPTTDSNGRYSDNVIRGWSGTVTPQKTGCTFTPSSRSYSNINQSQTAQDYTGSCGEEGAILTDDAQVRSAYPNNNYGSATDLRVRYTSTAQAHSYLKFSVNVTGQVQQATLRLYVYDGSNDGGAVYLVNNWAESTITWNNRPPIVEPPLDTVGNAPTNTWIEFDVTAAITETGTYSFGWKNNSSDTLYVRSGEASANQPQLVIIEGEGPPNDDFNNATQIGSLPYTTSQSTSGATSASDDPIPLCQGSMSKTVWYRYTPTASDTVRFDTAGSTFDTVLSVWTGTRGSLTQVGCNDDTAGGAQAKSDAALAIGASLEARLEVALNAGTTYYIMIGGYAGQSGTLALSVSSISGPRVTLTDDAYVRKEYPNSNYGAATDLRLRKTSTDDLDSFLKFTVSGLCGSVQQAKLRLYVTDGSDNGGSVYRVGDNWTESTITWNNAPVISGSPLSSLGAVTAGTWVEHDITAAITIDGTYSLALSNSSSNNVIFRSSEASANRPELVIVCGSDQPVTTTATPPPAPAATATPTSEPTATKPSAQVLPLVEAETSPVQQLGAWTTYPSEMTSGAAYVYSSGTVGDALLLGFSGTQVDIVYIQHPALGSFTIEVDGGTVQTITTTSEETVFGARVSVGDLADGPHTLKVYATDGTIAIDAFAVGAVAEILATPEPTGVPTEEPTLETTPEPGMETPTSEPPTATPQPPTLVLPFFETFDNGLGWTPLGSWQRDTVTAHAGAGWLVEAVTRSQSSTLTAEYFLDLTTTIAPQLSFWQKMSLTSGDSVALDISLDGGQTWLPLDVQVGLASDWTERVVDLAPYRGYVVRLRYRLDTFGVVPDGQAAFGWWIDDLMILDVPPVIETPMPTITVWPTETPTIIPPTSVPPETAQPTPLATETPVPIATPMDISTFTSEPPTGRIG